MKATLSVILGLLVVGGVIFAFTFVGQEGHRFFGKRAENIRHEITTESKVFVEGKSQILSKRRIEFLREESPAVKKALASNIRHEMAEVDTTKFSEELQQFMQEINNYY